MSSFINKPYLSFGQVHDPSIEYNREYHQPNEVIRVYYADKHFIISIANKKKTVAFIGTAADACRRICYKYCKGRNANLTVYYPTDWSVDKVTRLHKLNQDVVVESTFKRSIFNYLLLLCM